MCLYYHQNFHETECSKFQKVLEYTGWANDSQNARECHEVHECFFNTMMEKADKKGSGKFSLKYMLAKQLTT